MGTRVSYPVEVKMKAIEMRWYRNGEIHRLHQPVGKQYTFGKGPEYESETAKLQAENRYLKQQIEVLKKYEELERKWRQK